ncbi:CoA transferase [Pseudonocardia alaniniphila]|uniref:CoA transferase n=1 Tax=Pseudonocardia alaniniphila TaxID=75291 RepID=A0ABS9TSN6_9PSEU|nr:CoA transferase [Pseudonocardia alaniniphila]MCH6171560.1 CoA transferase [Pseudonocardia alaniniphila]
MFDTIEAAAELPLSGVRVVDAATIYAGPMIATLLGDFGADVVKVEHPHGDGLRSWEWRKDGESLWWALVGRNKRAITLALSDPRGAAMLRQLLAEADVFVENFRPGTLERWGLDPEDLLRINPRLVVVRVSGFGQTGPYRYRPGFGTLAEAISGFAGAFATMIALRHAERTGDAPRPGTAADARADREPDPHARTHPQRRAAARRTQRRDPARPARVPACGARTTHGRWRHRTDRHPLAR